MLYKPGAYLAIVNYKASVVKIYNATNSTARVFTLVVAYKNKIKRKNI
jgi:hypothetical protein